MRGRGVSSPAERSLFGALDRLAQPLHGEFDVLRLQKAPALDLGLIAVLGETAESIPQRACGRPCALVNFSRTNGSLGIAPSKRDLGGQAIGPILDIDRTSKPFRVPIMSHGTIRSGSERIAE